MESGFVAVGQGSTGPGMTAKMEGVLVAFSFILILESIVTEVTAVLLL